MPAVRPEESLEGREDRSGVVRAPLRYGPSSGGPQVVELHAKLVASLHHALAGQRFGPRVEDPHVEARMALLYFRKFGLLSGEALGGVLAKKLVQLEAAKLGSAHKRLAYEPVQ